MASWLTFWIVNSVARVQHELTKDYFSVVPTQHLCAQTHQRLSRQQVRHTVVHIKNSMYTLLE